tara:strand:- start:24 stop:398 length:375 start_codon:yes stop_codon:yes gene_type:complete
MKEPKILVIEDTQIIRENLSLILSFEGMQVIAAADGQEGIDKAKEHLPDLILCDIMMPKKNGFEVFDEIKTDNAFKNTPFLFLTAKATFDDIEEGMKVGAEDYITKPFNIDLLIKTIKNRLDKK